MYRGVEVQLHSFLTSTLYGDEWRASCPSHFNLWERAFMYILNRGLSGSISWSGSFETEKNFLPLLGIKPQIDQPVALSVY